MNLGRAITIASQVHEQQVDKAGLPYILHVLRIVGRLRRKMEPGQLDLELLMIATLHDIVEDSGGEWTIQRLREEGASERVWGAVDDLTHNLKDSYEHYIRLIGCNLDATRVKLEDLRDNSDITRLKDSLGDRDITRTLKYHKSYTYLINQLAAMKQAEQR